MAFEFDFTQDKLAQLLPGNREVDQWFPLLTTHLDFYQINTVQRAAAFFAQTTHESINFTTLHENLNYGAPGLMATFRHYFPTQELANEYARQPERIANRVYSNRLGNGNEASGDGWNYCGRGLIQVTGKGNYLACSQVVFNDDRLLYSPEWLDSKEGAIVSSCWYWIADSLNSLADVGDIDAITYRVNAAGLGIDDRRDRYTNFVSILS